MVAMDRPAPGRNSARSEDDSVESRMRSRHWRTIRCMANSVAAHCDRPLLRCIVVLAMIAMGRCSTGLARQLAAVGGAALPSAATPMPNASVGADVLPRATGRVRRAAEGSR